MNMIDILHKFIRAERTGNWELHLQAIQDMLPYMAASGHNSYTKSAMLYLQQMLNLKAQYPDVQQHFNKGLHEAIACGQVFHLTSIYRSETHSAQTQVCEVLPLECMLTPLLMLIRYWQLGT